MVRTSATAIQGRQSTHGSQQRQAFTARKERVILGELKKQQQELVDEINTSGIENATTIEEYETAFNALSDNAKKYVTTPADVKTNLEAQKTQTIQSNQVLIDNKIDELTKKLENKIEYYKEKIKYYKQKNLDDRAQRYDDQLEEYEAYYKGAIEKLKSSRNLYATYDDIWDFADSWGDYERDKQEARNKNRQLTESFNKQQPGETKAEYNQRLTEQMRSQGLAYLQSHPDAFGAGTYDKVVSAIQSGNLYTPNYQAKTIELSTTQPTITTNISSNQSQLSQNWWTKLDNRLGGWLPGGVPYKSSATSEEAIKTYNGIPYKSSKTQAVEVGTGKVAIEQGFDATGKPLMNAGNANLEDHFFIQLSDGTWKDMGVYNKNKQSISTTGIIVKKEKSVDKSDEVVANILEKLRNRKEYNPLGMSISTDVLEGGLIGKPTYPSGQGTLSYSSIFESPPIITPEKTQKFLNLIKNDKTELDVVRELFKVPNLQAIDRRVPDRVINELNTNGFTYLSNNLMVVTPEYERQNKLKANSKVAYWVVNSKTVENIKNELTYARDNVQLSKSLFGPTAGTFEQDKRTNYICKRYKRKLVNAKNELENEIAKFQSNPEKYPGALGQSTAEGTIWTISTSYLENLPAQKELLNLAKNIESEYLSAQKIAREMRTASPADASLLDKMSYGARNVRLSLGSMATAYAQVGLAIPKAYLTILENFGSNIIVPGEEPSLLGIKTFKFPEGSRGAILEQTPSTPSISEFNFLTPSSYKNIGNYLTELPSRPSVFTKAGITTAMLYAGGAGLLQTYKANIQALQAGSISKVVTPAMKTQAAWSTFGESLSNLGPFKIQPGIYGTGYLTNKEAMSLSSGKDNFIQLKLTKQPDMSLTSKPKITYPTDKIIRSKTTFPDVESFGVEGMPTELLTPVVRTSQNVFAFGGAKYSGFGLTPSITGIPVTTTTTVEPFTLLSNPSDTGMDTVFQRVRKTISEQPFPSSRYGFDIAKIRTTVAESGELFTSQPALLNDEASVTGEILKIKPIAQKGSIEFIDPLTGKQITGTLSPQLATQKPYEIVAKGGSLSYASGEGSKDITEFTIGGKTVVDKTGRAIEGFTLPTSSISKVNVLGQSPYKETILSVQDVFYPETFFMGGGGSGLTKSPGMSPQTIGFSTNIPTPVPAANIGPLSISRGTDFLLGGAGLSLTPSKISAPTVQKESVSSSLTSALVATPVSTPISTPVSTPVTTSISALVATPVSTPISTPVSTPISTPVATPITTPVSTPVATPIPVTTQITDFSLIPTNIMPGFEIPGIKKERVKQRKVKAYQPQIKNQNNKFVPISDKKFTREGANDAMAWRVDFGPAVEGRVVELSKRAKSNELVKGTGYYQANRRKFETFNLAPTQIYIEKPQYRQDKAGERRTQRVYPTAFELTNQQRLKGKKPIKRVSGFEGFRLV